MFFNKNLLCISISILSITFSSKLFQHSDYKMFLLYYSRLLLVKRYMSVFYRRYVIGGVFRWQKTYFYLNMKERCNHKSLSFSKPEKTQNFERCLIVAGHWFYFFPPNSLKLQNTQTQMNPGYF